MAAKTSASLFFSVAAGLLTFALLFSTAPMLPMAWDEANAINRAAGISQWFGEARNRGAAAFLDAEISRHWHYTVEIEGHPALYGIVIAVGQRLADNWLSPLCAARLGPMVLFGIAASAMFYRLQRQYSVIAALGATAALVTTPRLFAHAHFASFDGPLTSCWILTWALFAPALTGRWGQVAWGAALGATMSCKFTGWLAPLPFIAYAMVYGDRKTAAALGVGLVVALATFWLANPRLWHHPLDGTQAFFGLNLNRAGTALDIPTLFFGTRYDSISGLPWYNTLAWTAITVPAGILLLGSVGIACMLRCWTTNGQGVLILANWLVLIAARAVPGAPVHDAERLFLPSFAFLAALAGIGGAQMLCGARDARCRNRENSENEVEAGHCFAPRSVRGLRTLLAPFAVAAVLLAHASAAASVVWYAPQWLSYYSPLVGGLGGADAAGLEAAYYWDSLDGEALDWLHENTGSDEKIKFAAASPQNLALMQQWRVLRRGWRDEDPGVYRWYVIQRRPTFWRPCDRWLVEHCEPVFCKYIRPPTHGVGPWRLDVPLIAVYSYEDYERALIVTAR